MTASIQTKNDKYYIVLNWVDSGKRNQKWVKTDLSVTGNNKRKAEQKRVEILHEWEEKIAQCNNYEDILFSEFLNKWLEDTKHTIEDTTYSIYRSIVGNVIAPYFEKRKIKLCDLKAHHIQEFYSYKMKYDGVTANTIHHYHANIHKALTYAVKTERIVYNPASNVDLPKKQKHIANYYDVEEMRELLRLAKGHTIEPVVMLAAWFGLRRGEIVGLKWDCIDFENKTLSVQGTMTKTSYKERAKNIASLRTLPMTEDAVKYLTELKLRQQKNRERLGKHYNNKWNEFVCVKENGDIMKLDYVTRTFPELCEKCGLRRLKLHELRHSNISLLLSDGANLKEIQEWAGHSTYTTTADIYAHVQAQNKVRMSSSVEKLLST